MKKLSLKLSSAVASAALSVTKLNVNSCCMYVAHQPKLPENSKKLRKI